MPKEKPPELKKWAVFASMASARGVQILQDKKGEEGGRRDVVGGLPWSKILELDRGDVRLLSGAFPVVVVAVDGSHAIGSTGYVPIDHG